MMQPVEIIGGGLAGLALACGLARRGAPVTVFESGAYPRQRACGEFLNGLDPDALADLGIDDILAGFPTRRSVLWRQRAGPARQLDLPRPVRVASRSQLDARLAERLNDLGGRLLTGTRVSFQHGRAGRVFATGRRTDTASPWYGVNMHLGGMSLATDLEFHVGQRGYVGLCRLADGEVNLCGIFHRGGRMAACSRDGLRAHLEAARLDDLAERLAGAAVVDGSMSAVAGLRFGLQPPVPGSASIGDAFAFTPPYTGRGMATAFASAACALHQLLGWTHGELTWRETMHHIRTSQEALHRRPLRRAQRLHRFLLNPRAAAAATLLLRLGSVPLRVLNTYLNPSWHRPCFSTP